MKLPRQPSSVTHILKHLEKNCIRFVITEIQKHLEFAIFILFAFW